MTSYQKLKQRVEQLELDKTLLLKSIVYPEKVEGEEFYKLISMKFGCRLDNAVYNALMSGDGTNKFTGILNIK